MHEDHECYRLCNDMLSSRCEPPSWYLPNHNCEYPLWVLICRSTIPVILLIFSIALASAKKSFVLNIRNSLFPFFTYSKPQSSLQFSESHIHSSHSSIGSCISAYFSPRNDLLFYCSTNHLKIFYLM